MNFHINAEKLTEVTKIVNAETDPKATESLIETEICADWNEGQAHQDWIDSATPAEIADWIASFYSQEAESEPCTAQICPMCN